ncbi:hypothetical protein BY458DRAFT_497673 [Sporodiniella umbellata]|nr:hypothetical protein BY458DRAFT_497673 [Sporodiniella umbellata]
MHLAVTSKNLTSHLSQFLYNAHGSLDFYWSIGNNSYILICPSQVQGTAKQTMNSVLKNKNRVF